MAAVYATYSVEAYLDSAWQNLSGFVIGRIFGLWGIPRNGPIDFIAATGKLIFTLNNLDGSFSPDGSEPISADWKKGCPVRLVITYDGETRTWYGEIDDFDFDSSGPRTRGKITVTVVDWMNKAALFPINYPDMLVEKKANEIVQAIIDEMPEAPLDSDFATGINTFPVAFDTPTDFTRAYTELNKVLLSELCYLYVKHGGVLGETLVLENANSRVAPTPKMIPVGSANPSFLLLQSGDSLLLQTGDHLILNDLLTEPFASNNDALRYEASFGDNVINDIQFRYITRTYLVVDGIAANPAVWSSPIVPLPTTATPSGYNVMLSLDAGETRRMSVPYGLNNQGKGNAAAAGRFFETAGEKSVMKVWQKVSAGYGYSYDMRKESSKELWTASIYTDLVVSGITFFLDRLEFSITNNNANRGYIDLVVSVNTGSILVISDPETSVRTIDAVSIAEHDHQPLQFDMIYQTTSNDGSDFATKILAADAQPRTTLNRIYYSANRSSYHMHAFLALDIGDFFPVLNNNLGIDADFFVQDMKFTIDPGGIIHYELGVKEHYGNLVEYGSTYTQVGANVSAITVANVYVSGVSANGMLFCVIGKRAYNDVTSVTRGAQSFTKFDDGQYAAGNYPEYEVWYLANPTAGTVDTIITLPSNDYFEATVFSAYGVDQTNPIYSLTEIIGTGATASLETKSKYGEIVFNILSIEKSTATLATTATGQSETSNISADGNWASATSKKNGAGKVTTSWSISLTGRNWIYAAFSIRAAR